MALAIRYLLDTNTFSYVATGHSQAARARLVGLEDYEAACLSSLTEAEIRFGLAKRPRDYALRPAIEALVDKLPVLSWGSQEAEVYGNLRHDLAREGKPLGSMDLLIAAHAIAAGRFWSRTIEHLRVCLDCLRKIGRTTCETLQNP